jgi:hypothetical protein
MLTRPLGRPKNRWEDDIRNDMKKLKKKIGLAASRIAISGNYMLGRAKRSNKKIYSTDVLVFKPRRSVFTARYALNL